jgi:polar amino acid transport system permease protein
MRTCWDSFDGYILRALGRDFGEQLLPRALDITLCDQFVLIASGLVVAVFAPLTMRMYRRER